LKFSKEILSEIRATAKLGRDKQLLEVLEKAINEVNSGRSWQEEVGKWISVSNGYWNVKSCYKELGAVSTKDMAAIRQAILHYKRENAIEPWKARGYGWYRKKETDLIDIDWQNADATPLEIRLPLGMSELMNLYNEDMIVFAGEKGSGKSAMCLSAAEMNMDIWECHYFSSELGKYKINKRISLFETPPELWRVKFHYRHDNYQDVLFPNSINIIDFIIQTENFWEIGTKLKDIHLALKDLGSGVAIIAIQKSPHKEYGRGGDFAAELASLYVTLSKSNRAKIIDLKDWKEEENPNGKICDYKLVNASKFIQSTPWHYEEKEFKPKRW
jgi:hypothetical protein